MAYEKQRIQLRRDTAARWAEVNPTLLAGEFAYDTTNHWIKVGVGADWDNTPYVHISADFVDGLDDNNDNTIYCLSNVTEAGFDFMSADGTAETPAWTKLTSYTAKDWTDDIATAKAEAIAAANAAINEEAERAKGAESALENKIDAEVERATGKEAELEAAIDAEAATREEADAALQEAITAAQADIEGLETRMDAAEEAIEGLEDTKADKEDLTAYIPLSAANQDVTEDNKVATMADVAGLSGVVHFRGAFENDEATSGKSDKQAFIDAFAPVVKGDIAINTSNSKEYLAVAGNETTPATADDIRELGDEGIYATKAELSAAIDALSTDTIKLEPSQTVGTIKEENGVIAVTPIDIAIGINQVADLCATIDDTLSAAKKYADDQDAIVSAAVEEKLIGEEDDLSSADTIWGAKNYATDYVDSKVLSVGGDILDQAKAYTDEVSAELSDTVAETYLSASEVEGKVALSTISEVEAALTAFVKDVTVGGTSIVGDDKIANLGALATYDKVGEAELSGNFVFDCGGAENPFEV